MSAFVRGGAWRGVVGQREGEGAWTGKSKTVHIYHSFPAKIFLRTIVKLRKRLLVSSCLHILLFSRNNSVLPGRFFVRCDIREFF